jgi:hypothetical protein
VERSQQDISAAQIGALDLWILSQRGGIALQRDFAGFENVAEMGNFQCKVRILFHEQNRDALLAVDLHNFLKNRFTSSGARPSDGSSSISNLACSSARGRSPASAARRRSSVPAICFSRSCNRGNRRKRVPVRAGQFFVLLQIRAELQIFQHGQVRKNHPAFGNVRKAARDDLMRRQPAMFLPS